jgi:hypothetical protein
VAHYIVSAKGRQPVRVGPLTLLSATNKSRLGGVMIRTTMNGYTIAGWKFSAVNVMCDHMNWWAESDSPFDAMMLVTNLRLCDHPSHVVHDHRSPQARKSDLLRYVGAK